MVDTRCRMSTSRGVRVSAARDLLLFADKFQPGTRTAIEKRMPKAIFDAIQSSPRTSWLTLEQDNYVVNGLCETLGGEREIEVLARSTPD